MKRFIVPAAVVVLAAAALVISQGIRRFMGDLTGFEEVPAVSTVASGDFRASISGDETSVAWQLGYSALEGEVTQAHIHFGQSGVNGGVAVWLCSNLASPPTPAGVQPCPASPAVISGTFTASEVVGPSGQGIAPGELAELIRAIRAGKTYANVHSTKFPGGEVRSQLGPGRSNHTH